MPYYSTPRSRRKSHSESNSGVRLAQTGRRVPCACRLPLWRVGVSDPAGGRARLGEWFGVCRLV